MNANQKAKRAELREAIKLVKKYSLFNNCSDAFITAVAMKVTAYAEFMSVADALDKVMVLTDLQYCAEKMGLFDDLEIVDAHIALVKRTQAQVRRGGPVA